MIELNDIHFSYGKRAIPALDGITAEIQPGIVLLAGENGAGKTTLLHLIAGLMMPVSGECLIDGRNISYDNPIEKSRVFLLEERMFFPGKTIRQFAEMHSRFYPNFSNGTFLSNLIAFGLTGDEPLKSLSLGSMKRAQLAYVLALGVEVLLLDEPTNALDIESREILRRLIASSLGENQTIIISTHTVSDLETLFDGVVMLSRSRLIYAGTEEEVSDRLAFEVTRVPDKDALYSEIQVGRVLNIFPAVEGEPTKVDWRLLYSALHSIKSKDIINTLYSKVADDCK